MSTKSLVVLGNLCDLAQVERAEHTTIGLVLRGRQEGLNNLGLSDCADPNTLRDCQIVVVVQVAASVVIE